MSATPLLIPLANGAQTLQITLNKVTYQLTIRWNDIAQCWNLDIADTNGNFLLQNIPMVTGADLLEQFVYLGFGGQLVAQTTNNALAAPTFTNLGTTGNLYFVALS